MFQMNVPDVGATQLIKTIEKLTQSSEQMKNSCKARFQRSLLGQSRNCLQHSLIPISSLHPVKIVKLVIFNSEVLFVHGFYFLAFVFCQLPVGCQGNQLCGRGWGVVCDGENLSKLACQQTLISVKVNSAEFKCFLLPIRMISQPFLLGNKTYSFFRSTQPWQNFPLQTREVIYILGTRASKGNRMKYYLVN